MDAFKLLTNKLIECNNGAFVIDLISEPSKEQMQKLIEGSGNPESEMHQVNSSAGLAVNFWRAYELSHPESRVEFEWKKQVPLKRGIPANIDVVVRDSDKISFIESKFLEPYYSGNETPRSSYLEASKYSKTTEPAQRWVELFTQAESFQVYNVVQLCRHLLAIYKDMRKCPKDYEKRKVQLCSVTWKMPEPFLSLFTEEYQNAFIEKNRLIEAEAKECKNLINRFISEQLQLEQLSFDFFTYNEIIDWVANSENYVKFKKQYFL